MQAASGTRARSSLGFDWLMAVLAAALMGGLLLDGWAHTHGEVDQSFLTPWHALLYGSVAVNGLVLLGAGIAGLRKGFSFRAALPPGYWTAAIGVVVFLAGGGFDGWWHTAFGIETGIVLLISPPHLILALAAGLIMSGPLQSIAAQYDRTTGGWMRVGPAVVATWALVTLIGFFLAYAQPVEDGFTPLTLQPSKTATVYPMTYAVDAKGAVSRVATTPGVNLYGLDVSPDGKHMAYRVNRFEDPNGSPPSDIYVANVDGSHPVRITDSGRHDTLPRWSPDAKWIAALSIPAETSGNYEIVLFSPNGGSPRTLLSQQTQIDDIAWSPDGASIAFGSRNGTTPMIGLVDVKTGSTKWLPFTANSSIPAFAPGGIAYLAGDGSIRESGLDGSNGRKLAKSDGAVLSVSHDGRIAYINGELGGAQLFAAGADGSHPRDVSQLSGLDVQSVAWTPDDRLIFTALARESPIHDDFGKSLAVAATLIESILIAGAVLLLTRRWYPPLGAFTLLLAAFTLAMAVQSDFYPYAIGAVVTGIVADAMVFSLRDRVRGGPWFWALGFIVPMLFAAAFQIETVQTFGGSAWVWNLLLGVPMLAGAAGLLLAFCFDSPLQSREASA